MIKQNVQIPLKEKFLEGNLCIPDPPVGLIVFAHGSGSSRLSPRNQFVADSLNEKNLATLLIDLLTDDEEKVDALTHEFRFDIHLLTERLIAVTDWLYQEKAAKDLSLGYFGSSTGAASALEAAAIKNLLISAVVSRGGRPDLASDYLNQVSAPTLLIVGGNDRIVIDLNQKALQMMHCEKQLKIIPQATHLFEEPGALEQVAEWAGDWFLTHLHKKITKI